MGAGERGEERREEMTEGVERRKGDKRGRGDERAEGEDERS